MSQKKNKLSKILRAITPDQTSADFAEFDKQVSVLKDQLKEKITVKTLDDVSKELEKFKKRVNLEPFMEAMDKLRTSFDKRSQDLFDEIESKTEELSRADKERVEDIQLDISDLKSELRSLEEVRKTDLEKVYKSIPDLSTFEETVNGMMLEVSSRLDSLEDVEEPEVTNWQGKIDALRVDLLGRISDRGGSQNQQININSSVMSSRYADVNFRDGGGIVWTATDDNTTKRVNINASIIASGGGGSGITRTTSIITANTTGGTTASTDYVYFTNDGVTFNLPSITGAGSNMYTVKNMANSSVLVVSSEGIDDGTTALITQQYQSLSFIPNGSIYGVV